MGYFIGYKIAEAYYHQCRDKKQAIATLIETLDSPSVLERNHLQDQLK
ncbi:hypothetical protein [Catalinimonas alkaloidigena]|nr:hypothetical protein [Catalinimonas alkaloidigena]